ncbi:MAG: thiamine-monophosphate kinase, partial [Acidimicrobiia bacterium]|nr:thiamine-monophosphate kinase [Acidimicrobiia bacterium]
MQELELLRYVADHARTAPHVPVGPGDDMAVVRMGDELVLLTVDQVVDGRHVRLDAITLEEAGRKALTRSLSDVAAMAGTPSAALAAVTLPPSFGQARAQTLFDAMERTAHEYACPLVGGDIAFHADDVAPLVMSVTVVARPGPAGPVLRSGAVVGDGVYVTGVLGRAWKGTHHLTFTPRLQTALALAEALGPRLHAMMDLSDGLGRDACRLAEASGVSLDLGASELPRRDDATWTEAVGDGEDYEL